MLDVEDRRAWIKSRRSMRKQTRRVRLRRQIVRVFLLFFIIGLGFMGFTYLPWSVDDFENGIVVKGNIFTSSEQVRNAMHDCLFAPVYKVNPKFLEKKVESLETIKNAFVRRYALPQPHIVIEVLEEFPWASLSKGPGEPVTAVIAESGRIIPLSKFPKVSKPRLTFYSKDALKMNPDTVKQWGTWIGYIEDQTGSAVKNVDLRQPFDVKVKNQDLELRLGIADTTLTHRLGRLTSIMSTIRTYKDRLEYVDLALENNVPLKLHGKDYVVPTNAQANGSKTPIAANSTDDEAEDAEDEEVQI
jgi:cell division septal protein FtsQ